MDKIDLSAKIKLSDGRSIPIIGLGTWNLPEGEATENAVKWALDVGYRHFDTAKLYRNESSVGKAIREHKVDRSEIWVTTKLWMSDFTHPKRAFEESLARLDIDYIDLYLIHWPTPVEVFGLEKKLWRALESFLDEGLCKSIGVSNYESGRLEKILSIANTLPVVNQIKCSPFGYPKRLIEFCHENNIAVTGYSPLARGSGLDNSIVTKVAKNHGKSPAQIMLRWAIQKDIIVIPKSAHKERIIENADIFDFVLSEKESEQLDGLSKI